jgi:hypothetical protein
MTYHSRQASTIYVKEIDELVKSKTLHKYIFTGTDTELAQLRHRALGYARVRKCIITTTQKIIQSNKAIHLEYGGLIISKKPLNKYGILY